MTAVFLYTWHWLRLARSLEWWTPATAPSTVSALRRATPTGTRRLSSIQRDCQLQWRMMRRCGWMTHHWREDSCSPVSWRLTPTSLAGTTSLLENHHWQWLPWKSSLPWFCTQGRLGSPKERGSKEKESLFHRWWPGDFYPPSALWW